MYTAAHASVHLSVDWWYYLIDNAVSQFIGNKQET